MTPVYEEKSYFAGDSFYKIRN